MATVRELIAEFGFKIDDKQAKSFKKTIEGIQTAFNTFAVGSFLKKAGSIDNTFERTRRNIELLAGEKGLGLLEDAMGKRVVSSATEMATAVRNSLETLSDPKFTGVLIGQSEKLAVGLGKTADEIQSIFDEAAASQTIAPLQKLGLVTQQEVEAADRLGVSFTTATIKQEILNRVSKNAVNIQKQYEKALNRSDTQWNIFLKNMSDIGKMIGKFVNPIIARLLMMFNKIAEFFLNNPIGQFALKVAALAAAFTVLLGVIASLKVVFAVLALLFSPIFIQILLITAVIVALGLVIEDLWTTFTNPEADTFFRGMIDSANELLAIITQWGVSIRDFFSVSVPAWVESLFEMRGGGVGAISQAQSGATSNSKNMTDNRKLEINVTAGAGANGEAIAADIQTTLTNDDFWTSMTNQIPDTFEMGGIE